MKLDELAKIRITNMFLVEKWIKGYATWEKIDMHA